MVMPPAMRKVVLTLHVTTSVGWLGAVAAYLALDLVATLGTDAEVVRSVILSMRLLVWYVIVPLAIGSVVIGVVNALGTKWGLFRHYWVLLKLSFTLLATVVLLVTTGTVDERARLAAAGAPIAELPGTLLHSSLGLVLLAGITVLSVYKPRGLTPYGWRKEREARRAPGV